MYVIGTCCFIPLYCTCYKILKKKPLQQVESVFIYTFFRTLNLSLIFGLCSRKIFKSKWIQSRSNLFFLFYKWCRLKEGNITLCNNIIKSNFENIKVFYCLSNVDQPHIFRKTFFALHHWIYSIKKSPFEIFRFGSFFAKKGQKMA